MVNVFIVNSSSDGTDADRVKDYLEQADSAGIKHANVRILRHPVPSWQREFQRLMKETQLVLFLQGEHSAESTNIQWEINQALRLEKNVIVHQLDSSLQIPDWLKKQTFTGKNVSKAEICTLDEVKERIKRYDRKEYYIFSEKFVQLQASTDEAAKAKAREELFEQYKLYQATSEAVVERRQNVNNFYIIIDGAFLTIIGTIFSTESLNFALKAFIVSIICVAGVVLNRAWARILKSYGLLNKRKIQVLSLIEKELPLRLYDVEWEIMDDKMNLEKYKSFTETETRTPKAFFYLYLGAFIACTGYWLGYGVYVLYKWLWGMLL